MLNTNNCSKWVAVWYTASELQCSRYPSDDYSSYSPVSSVSVNTTLALPPSPRTPLSALSPSGLEPTVLTRFSFPTLACLTPVTAHKNLT